MDAVSSHLFVLFTWILGARRSDGFSMKRPTIIKWADRRPMFRRPQLYILYGLNVYSIIESHASTKPMSSPLHGSILGDPPITEGPVGVRYRSHDLARNLTFRRFSVQHDLQIDIHSHLLFHLPTERHTASPIIDRCYTFRLDHGAIISYCHDPGMIRTARLYLFR